MKLSVKAQFGYCGLVLMFHSRELNRKINHIHKRSLRIVYTDHNNSDLRIRLSVFTIETSIVWPLNYSK